MITVCFELSSVITTFKKQFVISTLPNFGPSHAIPRNHLTLLKSNRNHLDCTVRLTNRSWTYLCCMCIIETVIGAMCTPQPPTELFFIIRVHRVVPSSRISSNYFGREDLII